MSIYSHCGCGSPRPLPCKKIHMHGIRMWAFALLCVCYYHTQALTLLPASGPRDVSLLFRSRPGPSFCPDNRATCTKIYEEGVGREVVQDIVVHVSCQYACLGQQQVQGRGWSEVASAEAARVAIVFCLCRALGHAAPCRAPWRLVYSLCTHAVFRYVGKEPLSRSRGFPRSLLCPKSYIGRGILNF